MEDKIAKILQIQEKNIKKNKKINILIICDDVIIHSRSKQLINLSCMSRHYFITVILNLQYTKGLCSSSVRNNIDALIWSDLGDIALRSIYESIAVSFSWKEFKKFTQDNNHSYNFIMYDSRTQNKKERLKIIRARELKELKLITK